MKSISIVLLILTFGITQLYSQEFYNDGSMKLTEISSDKQYGYKPVSKTSIKVGKIENEQAFLKSLQGPNGESIQYRRIGSCCEFRAESAVFGTGFLDKYEISYDGLSDPVILYLNGYEYEAPKCPVGFTFKTSDKEIF